MFIVGHKDGQIEHKSNINLTTVKGHLAYTIIGGEFAVAEDNANVAFKTLLGSCVAIMFFCMKTGIKGMNHFLLPTATTGSTDMKYGLYSVEAMLNEMYKLGATKNSIRAKIAGGAHILQTSDNRIGDKNVEFALDFCKKEGISVLSEHTRGVHGRVILLTDEFKTFIRGVQNRSVEEQIAAEEKTLITTIAKQPEIPESGGIELF